ncbi:Uncharacterised protein [Mycobacteroides abscessus subsp. abscessus]|nr:Uncharacterised protein [Mycobacteroides abscessus subsp. abscessus]
MIPLGAAENSPYASSRITTPGATSRIWRSASNGIDCPVGLLGLVTKTTSGLRSRTAATALPTSSEKSSERCACSHSVWVPSEMIGCIE